MYLISPLSAQKRAKATGSILGADGWGLEGVKVALMVAYHGADWRL